MPRPTRPTLLVLFAHPDDETFATAGTIARCRRAGATVVLWTATDGEAGTDNRARVAPDALARVRRLELLRAAAALGIDRVHTPAFRDGALEQLDPEAVRTSIRAAVAASRPAVLVTFGSEGGPNRHRDHTVVSRLVGEVFAELGEEPGVESGQAANGRRLYHLSWSGGPAATCRMDVADFLGLKRRVFDLHRTQHHHLAEFEDAALLPTEDFALVAGTPQPAPLIDDLFAGL
jgi:LmbE family N-acetylglucosaminyl deacetylase